MTARARSPPSGRVYFTPHLEVDRFINTTDVSIWPCELPSEHSQLKNHISTSTKDIIYYVSSYEVFAIHVPTNRQELLASLDFKPTCIASGHGWICLGGSIRTENGRCAFIDMRYHTFTNTPSRSWSTEVDEALPLDFQSSGQSSNPDRNSSEGGLLRGQRPKVTYEVIGKSIINGITISKLISNRADVPEERVAVLSNNDKTVTIYSLTQQAIIKTLDLGIQINHASISPDGELLVAVGDINQVWFYRRSTQKQATRQRMYDWEEIAVIPLISTVSDDWSFASAWSPSGHLCMVASQFGVITVFETSKIKDGMEFSSAIIHSINSSRPCVCIPQASIPGAPRSMAFSPGPWDLVAWAEDHGRVTIADVRQNFSLIQTINVDVMCDKLERIRYSSVPTGRDLEHGRGGTLLRRHHEALEIGDPNPATQHATENIDHAASPRRHYASAMDSAGQQPPQSTLSDSERELIHLVATEQARDNLRSASPTRPYSINYSGRQPAMSSGTNASQAMTFGQYMLNRTGAQNSPASRTTPRRQASVVMSQNSTERANRASSTTTSSLTPIPPMQLSTSPSRLSEPGNTDSEMRDNDTPSQSNLEGTLSVSFQSANTETFRPRHRRLTNEILRLSHTAGSESRHFAEADRLLREQARAWSRRIHELRERAGQLTERFDSFTNEDLSFLDDVTNDIILGRETISRSTTMASGFIDGEVSIQGLGWSWDGQWLFVGTAKGIMRYKVNIPSRMRTPRINLA